MGNTSAVSEDDAVALVELLAKVAAHDGNHNTMKRLLLDALCELVDADRWNWALNSVDPTGEPRHAGILQGGFTLEQAEKLATGAHHPVSTRTFAPSYLTVREMGEQVEQGKPIRPHTVRLEDHPLYEEWQQSEAAEILAQAGIGTFISSVCSLSANKSSSVTIIRAPGREPFTERQRQMVHILMRGVIWLHTESWPDSEKAENLMQLPASHTVVLTLLLKGYNRKEIADARGLSLNTINTYTQRIFEHFSVKSQVGLMRQFLNGQN